MNVKEYKAIRKVAVKLNTRIAKWNPENEGFLKLAAKKLGILEGNSFLFDSEGEMEYLQDFSMYEPIKKEPLYEIFTKSDEPKSELEVELLQGRTKSIRSLYEVIDKDAKGNTVFLKNVLKKSDERVYNLLDISMSQMITPETLLFIRLIPLRDCFISSGTAMAFEPYYKKTLLSGVKLAKFKKGKRFGEVELFQYMFQKNRKFGIEFISRGT